MKGVKQYDILRYKEDEHGELYLNMNDVIKILELKKSKMQEVQPEHVTADKLIGLLRKYEALIKQLP